MSSSLVSEPVYVSLTSIFGNGRILQQTLESILRQSRLPDRIFLHLSPEPYLLDRGFPDGLSADSELELFLAKHTDLLEVRFVPNTGSYRKLMPLLAEKIDEDCIIITIDDDTEFNPELIHNMLTDYHNHGGNVSVNYRGFTIVPTKGVYTYESRRPETLSVAINNFATSKSGILYHTKMFRSHFDVMRKPELYTRLCPTADNIYFNLWRWANGYPLYINNSRPYMVNDMTTPARSLHFQYNSKNGANTRQLQALMKYMQAENYIVTFNPEEYWENRFRANGGSGACSMGKSGAWKGKFVSDFLDAHNVQSVLDLGCGDGSQTGFIHTHGTYLGVDPSPTAIAKCNQLFADDDTKSFVALSKFDGTPRECALSMDVVMCLVDKQRWMDHLQLLFNGLATTYVLIHGDDRDLPKQSEHVQYRRFTSFIAQKFPQWVRLEVIRNPHLPGSAFFVYMNMGLEKTILYHWRSYIHTKLLPFVGQIPPKNLYTKNGTNDPNMEYIPNQFNIARFFSRCVEENIRVLDLGSNGIFTALLVLMSNNQVHVTTLQKSNIQQEVLTDFPGRIDFLDTVGEQESFDVILVGDKSLDTAIKHSKQGTVLIANSDATQKINAGVLRECRALHLCPQTVDPQRWLVVA